MFIRSHRRDQARDRPLSRSDIGKSNSLKNKYNTRSLDDQNRIKEGVCRGNAASSSSFREKRDVGSLQEGKNNKKETNRGRASVPSHLRWLIETVITSISLSLIFQFPAFA